MVEIALEMIRKLLIALTLVAVSGILFEDLLSFGEGPIQTSVVLSFYVYCLLSLFYRTKHRLFHVLSIPILTQFLHLFQKYSFAAGANSLWRLLPFVLLDIYFLNFLFTKNFRLSPREKLFITCWIVFNLGFMIISPNLENILLGGPLLYLVTLPMYFLYLQNAFSAKDFTLEIEKYFFLLYLILGVGTFGLVITGAAYKGSDNLLVTRNISDTNVTMAYFILLWPLALLFARRCQAALPIILGLVAIFSGIVIFSFSRGAVFIIIPYLLISISLVFKAKNIRWLAFISYIILLLIPGSGISFTDSTLAYSWNLRFGDFQSINNLVQKLQLASGRDEIHATAYQLFLENPVFGHGIGSFEILGPGYREAHSLWYTLLAEQGLLGLLLIYPLFAFLAMCFLKAIYVDKLYLVLLLSLCFYLLFIHTVGSVFVIIPAKSLTINCIAPILLLCLYFYCKSVTIKSEHENGR
ncbi:O-antigen ligase family protein [Dyadobacter sp. CY323]|uniref:O-antigen ligase family protein n=1 Tax=Dyadobacter sp. CY323 TaxID=2907302 RepID=UPI001F32F294|nr:O-antigen ligase family protein [Dyadobacter sp. CY323]MCE6988671.1 O-antigen ligase family protein [Dyadobacter sp. CY323]